MDEKLREDVALFRYSLISPFLNGQVSSSSEYLSKICSKIYDVPYYGQKEFAPKTLMEWLRNYRKFGFDSLKPKIRNDIGHSRALSFEKKDLVIEFRKKHSEYSAALFYDKLISSEIINPSDASYCTIYRLLKANNILDSNIKSPVERRRFAYDKVNTLWQGDMSVGPYINSGGRKLSTNLFAFIDDCSRLVPYAEFFFTEKFETMAKVLKEALIRRGIPKIIYVDNGKIYRAQTLNLACAELGISLAHTRFYDPESKGKIERFFGTVRRRFYPTLKESPADSIEELNHKFQIWLENDYHRKIHSSIGMCPLDAFMAQADSLKMVSNPASLEPIFWKRDHRKVHSDSTISVDNKIYEVPMSYIGHRIEIRYDPLAKDSVHIFENNECIHTLKPVSLSDNAHVKRNKSIDSEDKFSFSDVFSEKEVH